LIYSEGQFYWPFLVGARSERNHLTATLKDSYNMFMKVLLGLLLLVLCGLQYRLWVGDGSLANIARLKQQIEQQSEENKRLQLKNDQLASEVEALRNGFDAIEAKAREELGFVKEDETYFFFVNEED